MSKKKQKKGLHPGIAVGLLVLGGGFAAKSILGTFAPARPSGPEPTFSTEIPGQPSAADAGSDTNDLLLVHGSFDRKTPVQLAFHLPADAVATVGTAPMGETAPVAAGEWLGDDPPRLRLGVVMLSGAARRASLGGKVVGIGDTIGEAKVRGIDRGRVSLQWRGRQLTYDLDGDMPIEFRAEQARRAAKQAERNEPARDESANAPAPGANEDTKPRTQKQESGR